jgi:2-octaprenylphenol hydroxylase
MPKPTAHFDMIVVGAGLVGSAFVLRLRQQAIAHELRIAVIERALPAQPASTNQHWGLRVSALSPESVSLLQDAGLKSCWPQLRPAPYSHMQVWDADGSGAVHFGAQTAGVECLGVLIENAALQSALWQQLTADDGLTIYAPQTWTSLERTLQDWRLTLSDGQSLHAPLIIAADGAQSRVRAQAGIAMAQRDYHQHGLVCTVSHAKPHDSTAWQRFLPTGPLAFLPTDHAQQSSIVWTLPSAQAQALCALPAAEFEQALAQAFEHRLGAVGLLGERACFPLMAQHAEHYARDGVVLIGDAAHSIHPLAGQGVNLGFLDVAALVDALVAQREAGLPWMNERAQRQYSRSRRGHNSLMMHAMTGFDALFGSQLPALRVLRNIGMRGVERSGLVKRFIAQTALQGRR